MRYGVLGVILVAEIGLFTAIGGQQIGSIAELGYYLNRYFSDILAQSAPVLLLAFGMTLVVMTAGIDLSVASMVALIACLMSSFEPGIAFWWRAVPLGLFLGIVLGLTNGVLIARLDIPPIVATLGTMILFRGLCFVLMGDLEKAPFIDVPGYEWFGQFPGAALVISIVYLGGGAYLSRSRWLREVLMLGGNRVASRYAGIPVTRRLCEVYSIAGGMAFLAALCFTARNSSVSGSSLAGLELHVIVAVVLGGTRVQGGNGTWIGSFLGVLILSALDEGLRGASVWGAEHLPFKISHLEFLALGLLLATGVWLNTRFQEHRE